MSLESQKLGHSLAVVLHMSWDLPSETCQRPLLRL